MQQLQLKQKRQQKQQQAAAAAAAAIDRAAALAPSTPSPLTADEAASWEALLAQDKALKARPKRKGKPSAEQREADAGAVRGFRAERKDFLATLTDEKRAYLDAVHQQRQLGHAGGAKEQQQGKEGGPSEAAQRVALREFAVRAAQEEFGTVVNPGLIDIGANLQGQYSGVAMARQLERAACAGVQAVILTGCDLAGSKKGAEACEDWATTRYIEGHQALMLWTTSGCHPHDASKIATVSEDGHVTGATFVDVLLVFDWFQANSGLFYAQSPKRPWILCDLWRLGGSAWLLGSAGWTMIGCSRRAAPS